MVDASALILALIDGGDPSDHAVRALSDTEAAAPHLIDLETASAAKRLSRMGELTPAAGQALIDDLFLMPIRRYDHRPFLDRIWDLRHNLSVYDASYVALAELLDAPLLTADAAIGETPGIGCPVEVIPTD